MQTSRFWRSYVSFLLFFIAGLDNYFHLVNWFFFLNTHNRIFVVDRSTSMTTRDATGPTQTWIKVKYKRVTTGIFDCNDYDVCCVKSCK